MIKKKMIKNNFPNDKIEYYGTKYTKYECDCFILYQQIAAFMLVQAPKKCIYDFTDFFIKYHKLSTQTGEQVCKSRIKDIIHGIQDCMEQAKYYYPLHPCVFPRDYERKILSRSKYKSNKYPCHCRHYLFGVWLYRNFFEKCVTNTYDYDEELYESFINNFAC